MEFCVVMKVRKHSPEITAEKGSDGRTVSERKACPLTQPDISLLEPSDPWIYHIPLFSELKPGQFCHQQVGITTLKRQKLLKKKRAQTTFESLKPGLSRMGLSAVTRQRSGAGRGLCWGHALLEAGRPAPPGTVLPFNPPVPRLLHLEDGEQWHLPTSGGAEELNCMCVEHSNGCWTLRLLYTPVYVTDRLVHGETSTSVSARHNYTACNIIKKGIFPLKEKKILSWAPLIIITH